MTRYRRRRRKPFPPHPIKEVIKAEGVKQKTIAMILHMDPGWLSDYLNGYRWMPRGVELDIIRALMVLDENTPQEIRQELQEYFFPILKEMAEKIDDPV